MAETIGQQLKQARLERHLSIEKVVEATRIRAHFIEAIEDDEFDTLPSPVQARAFLRNYAEFLGLSLTELIAHQISTVGEVSSILPQAAPIPVEPTPPAQAEPEPENVEKELSGVVRVLQSLSTRAEALLQRFKKPAPPLNTPTPSEKTPAETETVSEETQPPAVPEEPFLQIETASPKASQAIFSAIGASLRKRREMLSLTLEEIERHTHVRTHYLKALEDGDFQHLPSSVQAKGMLTNYARFLDLDVEALLLQFAEGLQVQRLERQPAQSQGQPGPKSRSQVALPAGLRRFLSMDILVGGGLVVLLLVFAVWGTSRIIGLRGATTPQPTAPSISDILGATPAETPSTPSPEVAAGTEAVVLPGVETAAYTLPPQGAGVVHVVLVALQSTWVRVVVDDKVQFEGRITPGTATSYDGNETIQVLTGNGAAVSILYNESDLGPMGTLGEVVDHIYTADSILNPTPTFTPSPTITPKPSVTPKPSPTLRPSSTPRPSATPKQ